MKKQLLLFWIALTAMQAFAQQPGMRPNRCDVALPDAIFRQKQRSVILQPSEELRLQVAMAIATNNCLSVDQVKSITALFAEDYNKLDFAKAAYMNTVDKENYYFVYDAFAYFSTAFMLHDYIAATDAHPHDYIPPYEPPVVVNFPPLDYPEAINYQGPANCESPMRDGELMNLATDIASSGNEADKLMMLTQAMQNNCITVAQMMKLASLLNSEPNRLSFVKSACNSVFDLGNLPAGAQLFAHIPNKSAYNDYITNVIRNATLPPPCSVSNQEFGRMLESIRKETFNSTKVTLAKQIIRSGKCFTTRQISEIVKLFTFDDTRLDIAEYAWDFTIDRENYYQLTEVFTFSSTKDSLLKFISEKH